MPLSLASPDWPAEGRRGDHLRRFGLQHFVLLSLLVHGLALFFKLDYKPPSIKGGSEPILSLELRQGRLAPALLPATGASRASTQSPLGRPAKGTETAPVAAKAAPVEQPAALQMGLSPTGIDASDLVERSKAELNAASRRQMIDPMFAPTAGHSPRATPIERATTLAEMKIEERGPHVVRVTNADGSRYCLQRLPEIATRDIPVPLVGVPMKCQ